MTTTRQWRVLLYFSRKVINTYVRHLFFCHTFVSTIFAQKKNYFSPSHTFASTKILKNSI